MRQAESLVKKNAAVEKAKSDLNVRYLADFSIGPSALKGEIGIARGTDLKSVLESITIFRGCSLSLIWVRMRCRRDLMADGPHWGGGRRG
jgi:hypothetical protein